MSRELKYLWKDYRCSYFPKQHLAIFHHSPFCFWVLFISVFCTISHNSMYHLLSHIVLSSLIKRTVVSQILQSSQMGCWGEGVDGDLQPNTMFPVNAPWPPLPLKSSVLIFTAGVDGLYKLHVNSKVIFHTTKKKKKPQRKIDRKNRK